MTEPLISICIPAYSADRFLAETLKTVADQTFTNWEVIVTEDGSRDRTEDIVRKFAGEVSQPVIYNRHDKNRGLPTTRNTGLAAARGEWIAFVDSDDLWKRSHLADLLGASKLGDYDLIFAGTQPFDDSTGEALTPCVPTREDLNALPLALYTGRLSILPSSAMIHRRALTRYGVISTDFPHANDTEYWLRILRGGGLAAYTGQTTCLYRKHANAMSLRASRILTNTAQICERYADWSAISSSVSRSRTGSLYRYAGRLNLRSNPRSAVKLLRRSLLQNPLWVPTWCYLLIAHFQVAFQVLGLGKVRRPEKLEQKSHPMEQSNHAEISSSVEKH